MTTPDNSSFEALSVESAAIVRVESAWQRARRNWSVRIGGVVLALLVLVAICAPVLGTVDPTLFDAASRDLLPGEKGEIMNLDGDTIEHTFLMGSDSFGRDIYSRVVYGTQVSLIVGVCTAIVSLAIGILFGL
ncbi:MAG: ABC transporter permease, partial [Quisquiliibacterium sp.]